MRIRPPGADLRVQYCKERSRVPSAKVLDATKFAIEEAHNPFFKS